VNNRQQQVWFITGSSRGFGRELVEQLLERGDKVIATERNITSLGDIQTSKENLLVLQLDITNEENAKFAAEEAIRHFGRIDVLVNNTGFGLVSSVEEASAEEIEKVFRTNVFGLLNNVTRSILSQMRLQRSGRILNLSSIRGLVGNSAKFAVEGLSESLAKEVKPLGIDVTIIESGFSRTDFLDKSSLFSSTPIEDYSETVGAWRKVMEKENQKQAGNPAKAAKTMIDIAKIENPPLRLMLGADTINMVKEKIRKRQKISIK
jgi:NAD(P)-dependent dehydrogenase (short-subunit alcohol dehydrogenase family)